MENARNPRNFRLQNVTSFVFNGNLHFRPFFMRLAASADELRKLQDFLSSYNPTNPTNQGTSISKGFTCDKGERETRERGAIER